MLRTSRGVGPPGNEAARRSPSRESGPKRFIGNSSAPKHNLIELREQATRRQRRQRMAEIVWRLGARAFFEFIDELDRHFDIPDLDRRLEKYANANPELVALLGGARFPSGPTRLVGGEH
jgi:hypothetical protein